MIKNLTLNSSLHDKLLKASFDLSEIPEEFKDYAETDYTVTNGVIRALRKLHRLGLQAYPISKEAFEREEILKKHNWDTVLEYRKSPQHGSGIAVQVLFESDFGAEYGMKDTFRFEQDLGSQQNVTLQYDGERMTYTLTRPSLFSAKETEVVTRFLPDETTERLVPLIKEVLMFSTCQMAIYETLSEVSSSTSDLSAIVGSLARQSIEDECR